MKYTYATLLLDETGAEINEHNLTAVLEAAGAESSTSRTKALVAALEDVDIGEYAAAAPEDDGSRAETAETAETEETEETAEAAADESDLGFDIVEESDLPATVDDEATADGGVMADDEMTPNGETTPPTDAEPSSHDEPTEGR